MDSRYSIFKNSQPGINHLSVADFFIHYVENGAGISPDHYHAFVMNVTVGSPQEF